jgi:hypothetical protein
MESSVMITKVLGILELGSLGLGDTTLQPGTYRFSPFAPRVTRPWEIPRAEVQWWPVASNGIVHGIISAEEAEIAERDGRISWLT